MPEQLQPFTIRVCLLDAQILYVQLQEQLRFCNEAFLSALNVLVPRTLI